MTAPNVETTTEWQNYIDLNNDTKPYLQFPAGASSQDAQLQTVIDAACWWAQDFLKQPIAPTQFFRRFNGYSGWRGTYIDLPYAPVLGVPTVVEYWGASGAHTLALQTGANQGGSDMFQLDAVHGIIMRAFLGLQPRPYFPGLQNIEVTWTAGYNRVPPHWALATKELVKFWWANTQEASRSFSRGGEYANPEDRFALWPGVPDRIAMMFETGQHVGIG